MGRHHRSSLRPRHTPHVARRVGAPAVLSAALLASMSGIGAAAEPDDPTSSSDRSTGTSAGLLDGVGSAAGTVSGTDESDDNADPSGSAGAGALRSTDVELAEKNGSGVSGSGTVDTERVTATASGLDPDERYVSFFYGATSSATNNNPCILDGTNPLPSDQTVGEWEVDENGNGTLSADNPLGARYALQAGTMSIRKVEHDFSKATALPVNPASYSLVACGEVERIAALDTVTDQVPKLPKLPSVRPVS